MSAGAGSSEHKDTDGDAVMFMTPPRKRKPESDSDGGKSEKKAKFDHTDREEKLKAVRTTREAQRLEMHSLVRQYARKRELALRCAHRGELRTQAVIWPGGGALHFSDRATDAFARGLHATVTAAAPGNNSKECRIGANALSVVFTFLLAPDAARFRGVSRTAYNVGWTSAAWSRRLDLGEHLGHVSDVGLLRAGLATARPTELIIDSVPDGFKRRSPSMFINRAGEQKTNIQVDIDRNDEQDSVFKYADALRLGHCDLYGMRHAVTCLSLAVLASGGQLRRLSLGGCFSIDINALDVILALSPNLTDLEFQHMGLQGTVPYAAALNFSRNTKLRRLSLLLPGGTYFAPGDSYNDITELEELHIGFTHAVREGALPSLNMASLPFLPKTPKLRVLTLTNASVDIDCMRQLRKHTKIEHLGLHGVAFGMSRFVMSTEGVPLAMPLTLTSLHLAGCSGLDIADALRQVASRLEHLVLWTHARFTSVQQEFNFELPVLRTLRRPPVSHFSCDLICPKVEEIEILAGHTDGLGTALVLGKFEYPSAKRVLLSVEGPDEPGLHNMDQEDLIKFAEVSFPDMRSQQLFLPWQLGDIKKESTDVLRRQIHRGPQPVATGKLVSLFHAAGTFGTSMQAYYSRKPCLAHPGQFKLNRWTYETTGNG